MIRYFLLAFFVCSSAFFTDVAAREIILEDRIEHPSNIDSEEVPQHQEALAPPQEESIFHGLHAAKWSMIPFITLLILIAVSPLFFEHFWHKHYPKISIILASFVVAYYLIVLHNAHSVLHELVEYIQFIALIASLYVASGGIHVRVNAEGKPRINIILLVIGAVLANIIGTTGASMLLIRPFIRLNKNRIKPYHIVFFIFIVSNVGGSLTPIGDPPLFLGFLKGVPFFWTLELNFLPWLVGISSLLIIFYVLDIFNKKQIEVELPEDADETKSTIKITGKHNFIWLGVIIVSVFLDPNIISWVPYIPVFDQKISFLRELIMFATIYLSFKYANKQALLWNNFSIEPIREVGFLFVGIFFTMMPALEFVSDFAQSPEGLKLISPGKLFWGTGIFSGFLDNAPTYVNFLTAALASVGGDINNVKDVHDFALGAYKESGLELEAISLGAVFFGALTYIGNGPNFMVKSIAEQLGIRMPSFFSYILKYSIPFLLPVLFLIWYLFF